MIATRLDIKNDVDIYEIGLQALKDKLGIVGTLKFLEHYDKGGSGNYTAEKYELNEQEPTDEEIRKMFGC